MSRDDVNTVPSGSMASSADAPPLPLTDNRFLGGRLSVLQPAKGYRAAIDAVFLAAAVPCKPGDTVFEAGLGTGVAALCALARVEDVRVTGVEIAGRYAELAEQNAKRNGFEDRLDVVQGDISKLLAGKLSPCLTPGSFAHALANPPYFEARKVRQSPDRLKSVANAQACEDLEVWVKALASMVEPNGTVTFVHRAEVLGRLLKAMEGRLGDIRIAPLFPRQGRPASRVIVQGVKGSKAPLQLLPGLVLHGAGSGFTPDAEAVLRHAAALPLR